MDEIPVRGSGGMLHQERWDCMLLAMPAPGEHKNEQHLNLAKSGDAAVDLERVLTERTRGPFGPLEPDWKERVRCSAAMMGKGRRNFHAS